MYPVTIFLSVIVFLAAILVGIDGLNTGNPDNSFTALVVMILTGWFFALVSILKG